MQESGGSVSSRGGPMSRGVRLATALAISVVGVAVLYGGTAASSNQSKIEGRVLRDTANGNQASIVINLKAQADLSAAYKMTNQNARGWYVYRTHKGSSPATIEPNITKINAPPVWAMGYTGQGIVVANQDTGMRWTHQALKPHYRGWNGSSADHNYNWWDAIHSGASNPCGFNN